MEAVLYRITQPLIARDISMGVLCQLYGCSVVDTKGGVFYGPQWFNLRGYPAEKEANKATYGSAALKRFWKVSEKLTGVTYSFS